MAIVNWNSGSDLVTCVDALRLHTAASWELLVVDNGSTDDSLERLQGSGGGGRVIKTGENVGYAGGVNRALAEIRTPFALFVNPDAFVHEGCVDALLRRAQAEPRAASVGSGLRNSDGSLQPAARNFPSPLTHLVEAFRLYIVLRHLPLLGTRYLLLSKQDRVQRVDWIVGACMLLRLEAVHEVGPFDDRYFMYSEELDWCLRANRKGWEIWFEPDAVATHRLGGSSRQNELPLMVESYRSMYRFYTAYYSHWTISAVRLITRAAMAARALSLLFRPGPSRERLAAYREIAKL